MKNACTTRELVSLTVHVKDVPQGALQCENSALESGVAVRVTFSPLRPWRVHAVGQWIPDGVEVTVPLPLMPTFNVGLTVLPVAAPTSPSAATVTRMRVTSFTGVLAK